ncbi:hypothetical protein J2W40_002837 [Sphingobium xenophagum]|uniref:Uncharacterized protein n=1 Tax=Sphingobium xenophagum TaxID=121428 RepID=A0ABU1X4E2_SPHXE|nr:hypothetical protein [Sphingobium xenophagum]MDR7156001.1 hypothetical protein [Sphingobium xenophagum]
MNMLADEHAGLSDELSALDRVLESFAPDMDIEAIPPLRIVGRVTWAAKGEITRAVFAVLRKANGPMTTDAIAQRVAEDRGEAMSPRIRKSVYKALDQARQRGNVEAVLGGWRNGSG